MKSRPHINNGKSATSLNASKSDKNYNKAVGGSDFDKI